MNAGTQVRVCLDDDVIVEYRNAMQAGDEFPPVDVFDDGERYILADGFHRYFAALRMGRKDFPCVVHHGKLHNALKFALGAKKKARLRLHQLPRLQTLRRPLGLARPIAVPFASKGSNHAFLRFRSYSIGNVVPPTKSTRKRRNTWFDPSCAIGAVFLPGGAGLRVSLFLFAQDGGLARGSQPGSDRLCAGVGPCVGEFAGGLHSSQELTEPRRNPA